MAGSPTPDAKAEMAGGRALASHVAPFLVWIGFIFVFEAADAIGAPLPKSSAPAAYAAKSAICAALLALLKPWRAYRRGDGCGAAPVSGGLLRDVSWGLGVGLLAAFLWIFPETPFFFGRFGAVCEAYHRWLIMPLGAFPEYFSPQTFPAVPSGASGLAFSPGACGWPLALARLAGSAFVIAVAEEYFFRGFLYRWLRDRRWDSAQLADYEAQAFWTVVAVFAFEHDRWFMGGVAGILYGALAIRTGRLRAPIVAHVATNFVLGLYVLATGQFGFW